MRYSWLNVALVSLILTLAFVARAEEFVLIVIPSGDNIDYSPFENRLRSELTAAGYSTITATLPAPIESTELLAHAKRFATNICVSVSISDAIVFGFVSVADPANDKNVTRAVPGYPIGEQAPSIFAVRATDVLHAVLLELNYAPSATQQPSKPEPEPRQASDSRKPPSKSNEPKEILQLPRDSVPAEGAKPPAAPGPAAISAKVRHWGVSLGVAFIGATHARTMPIAPGGAIGLFRQERYWGLSAEGSAYLPVAISHRDSKITANQWLASASFQLFQPLGPVFRLFESVGLGACGLSVSGTSAGQAIGRNASDVLPYSRAGAGLISDFDERTALALQLSVLSPWRVADIIDQEASGSQTVAQFKFPTVAGDLGLRVAF